MELWELRWVGSMLIFHKSHSVFVYETRFENQLGPFFFCEVTARSRLPTQSNRSSDNFHDWLDMLHADQLLIETSVKVSQPVWIKSHLVQHCCMQSFDVHR